MFRLATGKAPVRLFAGSWLDAVEDVGSREVSVVCFWPLKDPLPVGLIAVNCIVPPFFIYVPKHHI